MNRRKSSGSEFGVWPLLVMWSIFARTKRHTAPPITNSPARMPMEMLEEVLAYLSSHNDVWNAAHVSRRWRDAAHSHSEYYLPVKLYPTDSWIVLLRPGQRAVRAAMSKSGPPLSVTICIDNQADGTIPLRRMFNAVARSMAMIKILDFVINPVHRGRVASIMPSLSTIPAPRLEVLRVNYKTSMGWTEPISFDWPVDLFQRHAPRLRVLDCRQLVFPAVIPIAFSNLQKLVGFDVGIPHLGAIVIQLPQWKHLNLDGLRIQRVAAGRRHLAQRQTTTLETLSITFPHANAAWEIAELDISSIKYVHIMVSCNTLHTMPFDNRWLLRGMDQPLKMRMQVGSVARCFSLVIQGGWDKGVGEALVFGWRGAGIELYAHLVDIPMLARRLALLDICADLLAQVVPALGYLPMLQQLRVRISTRGLRDVQLHARAQWPHLLILVFDIDCGTSVTSAQLIELAAQLGVPQGPCADRHRIIVEQLDLTALQARLLKDAFPDIEIRSRPVLLAHR